MQENPEVNPGVEEEPVKTESKKKYDRTKLKIDGPESARLMIAKAINESIKGKNPPSYYKDLAYMIQVYLSTDKLVKEESATYLDYMERMRSLWSSISYITSDYTKKLTQYLEKGDKASIDHELKMFKSTLDNKIYEVELELIKKFTGKENQKNRDESHVVGSPSWISWRIKKMLTMIPQGYINGIVRFMRSRNMILEGH